MTIVLSTVFALGTIGAAGAVVVLTLTGVTRMPSFRGALPWALAFIFGMGVISLQMFFYALFALPMNRLSIALPWWVALAGMGWTWRRRHFLREHQRPPSAPPHTAMSAFLAGIVAVQVGYCLVFATSRPVVSWDGWAIWFLKAKAFFASSGLPTAHFFASVDPHPDYPLLTPLTVAWHYLCLGVADEQIAKILFPLTFLALLMLFYSLLREETGSPHAWFFTALLALTPFAVFHAGGVIGLGAAGDYVGYADLTLATYFFGATASMYRYLLVRDPRWLLVSFLCLGMGAWTKNEGLPYAIWGSVTLMIAAKHRRIGVAGLGVVALFIVPWGGFKMSAGFANDILTQSQRPDFGKGIERLSTILAWGWRSAMQSGMHGLIWPLFVISAALNWRNVARSPLAPCVLLVGVQLGIYGMVYFITPRDLEWHLATSIDRVLLHLSPIALWIAGVNVYQLSVRIRGIGQGSRIEEAIPAERIGETSA